MRTILAVLATLALSTPVWADSPTDNDNGKGNDPQSHAPGQTNNPNPGKLFEQGPAWLSGYVVAASQCCTQTNGGGNTPNGTAVGVPNTNNGGNAPPGQQPSPPGQ